MKLVPEPDFPELQREPKSGVWYVRKEIAGRKPLFKSTGERKSKIKAAKIARMKLAEYLCMSPAELGVDLNFDDVCAKVLELKKNRSPRTIRSAEDHIKKLKVFFSGYRLKAITEESWENYIALNQGRKLFNDWKQMRSVVKYAHDRGLIPRKLKLRNPDAETEAGKAYSDDELEALMRACTKLKRGAGPDLWLQIRMGYLMGMRKLEILNLPWWFVDWEEMSLKLPPWYTKTRRGRVVPIHEEIMQELWARFWTSESVFVFPSPEDHEVPVMTNKSAWGSAKRLAKVAGRFHDLRHTFMTNSKRYGISLDVAARIAGMSIVVAFKIYSHPTVEELRKAVNSGRGIPWSSVDNEGKEE